MEQLWGTTLAGREGPGPYEGHMSLTCCHRSRDLSDEYYFLTSNIIDANTGRMILAESPWLLGAQPSSVTVPYTYYALSSSDDDMAVWD